MHVFVDLNPEKLSCVDVENLTIVGNIPIWQVDDDITERASGHWLRLSAPSLERLWLNDSVMPNVVVPNSVSFFSLSDNKGTQSIVAPLATSVRVTDDKSISNCLQDIEVGHNIRNLKIVNASGLGPMPELCSCDSLVILYLRNVSWRRLQLPKNLRHVKITDCGQMQRIHLQNCESLQLGDLPALRELRFDGSKPSIIEMVYD